MKKTIALVTGGFSGEAVISYKSAITIGNNLDSDKFDVYKIDINPDGWFYEDGNGKKMAVDKNDFSIESIGCILPLVHLHAHFRFDTVGGYHGVGLSRVLPFRIFATSTKD